MRVKGGFVSRRRHKRVIKDASGTRGRKGNCFKLAKRSLQKAMKYAYIHRKQKKRTFRSLWIIRVNAAARANGLSYSRLIRGLKLANVELDRKQLAHIALTDPAAFTTLADQARAATAA